MSTLGIYVAKTSLVWSLKPPIQKGGIFCDLRGFAFLNKISDVKFCLSDCENGAISAEVAFKGVSLPRF